MTTPHIPGPGVVPPTGKPKATARGGFVKLLTVVVSVVALLLGVVAAGLSWRAYVRSGEALAIAAAVPAAVVPAPTVEPTTETPVATEPTPLETTEGPVPDPSGSVPVLNAETEYKPHYTGQLLRLPAPTGCDDDIAVDLDEPRVFGGGAELIYLNDCNEPARIKLETGAQGSQVESSAIMPSECAERIRTSPLAGGEHPAREAQVYCVMTSLGEAGNSAQSWKMAVVKINDIAEDGTVVLKVSAWDIPT